MRFSQRQRLLTALFLGFFFAGYVSAQTGQEIGVEKPGVKRTARVERQLVEENEYFRVTRAELVPDAVVRLDQQPRDMVILVLGIGLTLTKGKATDSDNLKDGEARFLEQGTVREIVNAGNGLSQLIVVELKRHWDVEVRACSEPKTCTRLIKVGDASMGETTSLFTNGFVTAYRHRLDLGGTLSSSYFSSKGKDHLLLMTLTDLQVNFDGTEETLHRGQTYSSDASEIEVSATKAEAQWVVLRMQIPKA